MSPTPVLPVDADASAGPERRGRRWWVMAGLLAGVAGTAVAQFVADLMSVRETPLMVVASAITDATPGTFAQATVEFLASILPPVVLGVVVLGMLALFGAGGLLWRRSVWVALPVWLALAAVSLVIASVANGFGPTQVIPTLTGLGVWLVAMALMAVPLRRSEAAPAQASASPLTSRRTVLRTFGLVGALSIASGAGAWGLERRRAAIDESRKLLRIPGVTRPRVPVGAETGLEGLTRWQTPNGDFHVPSSSLRSPALDAVDWRLRIHGMVENPMELSYADLIESDLVESWIAVATIRDDVDASRLGNAWWSGVPTSVLLAAAGVRANADVVLQTGADGRWCATGIDALAEASGAMLAVAMNGQALPLEHGFPVRTVVPGLYTESGDCRWVVDWEVTTLATLAERELDLPDRLDVQVRLGSRIDLPPDGETVPAGAIDIGGMAWQPGVGIERVQYSLDGSEWRDAVVAHSDVAPVGDWTVGTEGAWVQWTGRVRVDEGDHELRVRAINRRGEVQTGVRRESMPSGASGWHVVNFSAQSSST